MHSVLAIARVTLKDALRKKVLFTVLFFAVLLTVASGFLPAVMAQERINQVAKVCLSGLGFFGMIVAIFLAAPNLPDDISKKTIFTVLTKPARRWEIIAGKILGLGYVLAILLLIMGSLSYAYINFWAWKMGPAENAPARLGGNKLNYAESVEYHGLTLELSRPMIESNRAIASGIDRITFHFTGLDKENFSGDMVFAKADLFSHGSLYDSKTNEGTAALEFRNPTTGEAREIVFGQEKYLPFDRAFIDKAGALDISVLRHLASGRYSAKAASVAVLSQPTGYGVNFLKALVMMFMQYMVLVFVATAASTFLTSTVSTITALFIYFTGSFVEVLRDQALALGSTADIFTMAEHTHEAQAHQLTGLQWLVNILLRYFYLGITIVFPNLTSYNVSAAVSQNEYISGSQVAGAFVYAALYAAVAYAIAVAVFMRKEVA